MLKSLYKEIDFTSALFTLVNGGFLTVKSAYIHIPFCVRICTYCDFNKYFIDKQPVDEYLDALIKEMQVENNRKLETMYVGGGTPTALNIVQLEKLLKAINNTFTIHGEYSFEANPDELTYEKVALLKNMVLIEFRWEYKRLSRSC